MDVVVVVVLSHSPVCSCHHPMDLFLFVLFSIRPEQRETTLESLTHQSLLPLLRSSLPRLGKSITIHLNQYSGGGSAPLMKRIRRRSITFAFTSRRLLASQ